MGFEAADLNHLVVAGRSRCEEHLFLVQKITYIIGISSKMTPVERPFLNVRGIQESLPVMLHSRKIFKIIEKYSKVLFRLF